MGIMLDNLVNAQMKKILMEETISSTAEIILVAAAVKVNCLNINKLQIFNKEINCF
jgi:hypothetical protein